MEKGSKVDEADGHRTVFKKPLHRQQEVFDLFLFHAPSIIHGDCDPETFKLVCRPER